VYSEDAAIQLQAMMPCQLSEAEAAPPFLVIARAIVRHSMGLRDTPRAATLPAAAIFAAARLYYLPLPPRAPRCQPPPAAGRKDADATRYFH